MIPFVCLCFCQLLAQVLSLLSLTVHVDAQFLLDRLLAVLSLFLPHLRTSHPSLSAGLAELPAEPTEKESRAVVLAALQQLVSLTQKVQQQEAEEAKSKHQVTSELLLSKLLPLTLELLVRQLFLCGFRLPSFSFVFLTA